MTALTYLIRDDGWRLALYTHESGMVASAELQSNGTWRCVPVHGVGHMVPTHDAALTWLRDLVAAVTA